MPEFPPDFRILQRRGLYQCTHKVISSQQTDDTFLTSFLSRLGQKCSKAGKATVTFKIAPLPGDLLFRPVSSLHKIPTRFPNHHTDRVRGRAGDRRNDRRVSYPQPSHPVHTQLLVYHPCSQRLA